jgi:ubiquinone/menaquinone biosynthesis C-methylase UbiE/DNA-binding transcriptional ArsR family regulator
MLAPSPRSPEGLLAVLRAVGEPTRLRIVMLLLASELTVKDLTTILGQSQPRISRHLKLLAEAGVVHRHPEGAWVYYRLADEAGTLRLVQALAESLDMADPELAHDRERLAAVKRAHAEAAARYFAEHAAEWDEIRSLHVAEDAVEAAMLKAIGNRPFQSFLDLGTGTGRILVLFHPLYERAVGIDASADMLAIARANLDRAGVTNAQVRLGDIFHLALPRESFDVVAIHQVLHFLDEPGRAIAEAARALRPGGRLLVVDFAPHELEFLRDKHAHRRLGFTHAAVRQWMEAAGLTVERIDDLPPRRKGGGTLTVTLWLARDPRIVVTAGESRIA